jgi:hypothetical protein
MSRDAAEAHRAAAPSFPRLRGRPRGSCSIVHASAHTRSRPPYDTRERRRIAVSKRARDRARRARRGGPPQLKRRLAVLFSTRVGLRAGACRTGPRMLRDRIAHCKAYGALAMGPRLRALFQPSAGAARFHPMPPMRSRRRAGARAGGVCSSGTRRDALLGAIGSRATLRLNDEVLRDGRIRGRRPHGRDGPDERPLRLGGSTNGSEASASPRSPSTDSAPRGATLQRLATIDAAASAGGAPLKDRVGPHPEYFTGNSDPARADPRHENLPHRPEPTVACRSPRGPGRKHGAKRAARRPR